MLSATLSCYGIELACLAGKTYTRARSDLMKKASGIAGVANIPEIMAKAEFYVRQHQDNLVIAKLRSNVPLTQTDVSALEQILWSEVGTKQDYEAEYGQKPLGEFVRTACLAPSDFSFAATLCLHQDREHRPLIIGAGWPEKRKRSERMRPSSLRTSKSGCGGHKNSGRAE